MTESQYWADQIARKIIKEKGNKKEYVVEAGITPSGTIHIGNFREAITVDLIARALKSFGKNVRFIYTWDDFDRLRKIPKNMPNQDMLTAHLGFPVGKVPDPFECHESYAEHLEKEFEESLVPVGIAPKFIYQIKRYQACKYKEEIKQALKEKEKIKTILNKYRKEPYTEYWPIQIYCTVCNKDTTEINFWDGKYTLKYTCTECKKDSETDFSKQGNVKLRWRTDWPMRWHHEQVDFEPAGKDLSTPGSARETGVEIQNAVYGTTPPLHQMYEFVIVKGFGGKMSSSKGNVLSLRDVLEIYIPEIVRFYFAGTKPNKEFSIATDEEVFKVYEDFFFAERVYYGKEKVSERDKAHWSRVYEMSVVDKPEKEIPIQPSFRHCIELINIHKGIKTALDKAIAIENIKKKSDKDRYEAMLERAKNWLEYYAPEKYKFEVQTEIPSNLKLSKEQKHVLKELAKDLKAKEWTESELFGIFGKLCEAHKLPYKDLFAAAYGVLLNKEKGPRLAPFILAIGKDKVANLFEQV